MENSNMGSIPPSIIMMVLFILFIIATGDNFVIIFREWYGRIGAEVLLVVLSILFMISLIQKYNINMNEKKVGHLEKVITVEGFSGQESFCDKYSSNPAELDQKCGELTEDNCNSTGCCVWLNGKKCVAGNKNGPTFKTEKDGSEIVISKFSHKTECKGNC